MPDRPANPPPTLPDVALLTVAGINRDGEPIARPAEWTGDDEPPLIFVLPGRRGQRALTAGDTVLAKLSRINDRLYEARAIRRVETSAGRILGVYRPAADGGRLTPTDRRQKTELVVLPENSGGAEPGELVLAEVLATTRLGLPRARVVERLGSLAEPRAFSLVAIHTHGIPTMFPPAALREAEVAAVPSLHGRIDLRSRPLVTIDGDDARDFDDAVWAEPDPDPANGGGWHLTVAIADVAHYVRPGSALDGCARERGNSCYFPDRVVPMLPEALSTGLCSLKPGEDRGCLAMEMWIGADGVLRRHAVVRGLMRSAARLTYEQVQAAFDGRPDGVTTPLVGTVLAALHGAFLALADARARRGTLDLDLPERRVQLDPSGQVLDVGWRERHSSHRLIEEFMICANVAAAESLEARGVPGPYRVHDQPAPDTLAPLARFLESFGIVLAKGQVITPRLFARILADVAARPEAPMVQDAILRAQAQAVYSTRNIGHFGLALRRYMHFTSPIRRYADLLVHRALIRAHGLGPGGIDDDGLGRLPDDADHVSMTERRAAAAERDTVDRYAAAWLAQRAGATLPGRIASVSRFGLFIRLRDSAVDGFVPASTLPDDRYRHDDAARALIGERWGRTFRQGSCVDVRIERGDPVTGAAVFSLQGADGTDRGIAGEAAGRIHPGQTRRRRGR